MLIKLSRSKLYVLRVPCARCEGNKVITDRRPCPKANHTLPLTQNKPLNSRESSVQHANNHHNNRIISCVPTSRAGCRPPAPCLPRRECMLAALIN